MDTYSTEKPAGVSAPAMPTATSRNRKDWRRETKAAVWEKSSGACHYCGCALNPFDGFTIDHVVARSKGGSDDLDNLVASCLPCNSRKHTAPTVAPIVDTGPPYTIAVLRHRTGLSQADYAGALGVSPATVYVWEARKSDPTAKQLRTIARYHKVSMDTIDFDADPDKRRKRQKSPGAVSSGA